jgi:uncharacterized protein (TIGR03067 family)
MATRLARGRALLAKRLARHRLALAAGVPALAWAQGTAPACVPTSLVVSTVRAATAVAAGRAAAVGVISAKVAALTEGVLKIMLLTKLKALAAVLLAVSLLGGGGAMLAYGTLRVVQKDAQREGLSPTSPDEQTQGGEGKAKSDKEALQGTWVGVSGAAEGQELPKERYWLLVFDGDAAKLRMEEGGKEREGVYTINSDKKPKEIDLTLGSLVLTGIYELKGTTLKTLWRENDRAGLPGEFDSSKGGMLMVFEKKK